MELLKEFSKNGYSTELAKTVKGLSGADTVAKRIQCVLPGYYGQIFTNHFASYLMIPIETEVQERAFLELIEYLDNLPNIDLTLEEEKYLEEVTSGINLEMLDEIESQKKMAIDQIDEWYAENQDIVQTYLEFKQSEQYKSSPMFTIENKLKDYLTKNNYTENVIPLVRKISPEYNEYYEQLLKANQKFSEKLKNDSEE